MESQMYYYALMLVILCTSKFANVYCTLSRISIKECGETVTINCPIRYAKYKTQLNEYRWTRDAGNDPIPTYENTSGYSNDLDFNNYIKKGKITINKSEYWYNLTITNVTSEHSAYYGCSWNGHGSNRYIVRELLLIVCSNRAITRHKPIPVRGTLTNLGVTARRIIIPCTVQTKYSKMANSYNYSTDDNAIKIWVRKQLYDDEYEMLTINEYGPTETGILNEFTYSYTIKKGEIGVAGTYYCTIITPRVVLQSEITITFPGDY